MFILFGPIIHHGHDVGVVMLKKYNVNLLS